MAMAILYFLEPAMAIPSSGFAGVGFYEKSSIFEPSKQSINFKSVLRNEVSNFPQNPISVTRSRNAHIAKLNSARSDTLEKTLTLAKVLDLKPEPESGGGDDGNGNFPPGNGGNGGGDDGGDEDDYDEKEFGPLLKFEEVMKVAETQGVNLPSDMLEAAKATGLRELMLTRYMDLQGSGWALGFPMKHFTVLRNRMLADPSFLFKVGTEIVTDSCCATFAEVQKRGKDFWAEFQHHAVDLLTGVVVNVALFGMLAPYAVIGKRTVASGVQNSVAALPSSAFESESPGCRFSAQQRLASYYYKGTVYGSVGSGCGIIDQGVANMKRRMHGSDENLPPVSPLVKSAAIWGVFLAASFSTHYQVMNGLESVVENSVLAKQILEFQCRLRLVCVLKTTSMVDHNV